MKLIGISGTNGSGKDTLAELLAKDHGWLFVSGSDILRDELKRRRLPIERENLRLVGNEWRRTYGLGHLIDKAVEEFKKGAGNYKGLVVASLRNPGEADRVHELGGQVVWVDAPPKLRYERIYSRQRSKEDDKTFEQFQAEEEAEMSRTGDSATLDMAGVKAISDFFLSNSNNDIEAFKDLAEKTLKKYL